MNISLSSAESKSKPSQRPASSMQQVELIKAPLNSVHKERAPNTRWAPWKWREIRQHFRQEHRRMLQGCHLVQLVKDGVQWWLHLLQWWTIEYHNNREFWVTEMLLSTHGGSSLLNYVVTLHRASNGEPYPKARENKCGPKVKKFYFNISIT
jgi:hypothetical protein